MQCAGPHNLINGVRHTLKSEDKQENVCACKMEALRRGLDWLVACSGIFFYGGGLKKKKKKNGNLGKTLA